jgi:hypothetical protein
MSPLYEGQMASVSRQYQEQRFDYLSSERDAFANARAA